MHLRPPVTTLLPYTTLFRSTKILSYLGDVIVNKRPDVKGKYDPKRELHLPPMPQYDGTTAPPPGMKQKLTEMRSEEHTSELQSPCNLVCRLLLEKKK